MLNMFFQGAREDSDIVKINIISSNIRLFFLEMHLKNSGCLIFRVQTFTCQYIRNSRGHQILVCVKLLPPRATASPQLTVLHDGERSSRSKWIQRQVCKYLRSFFCEEQTDICCEEPSLAILHCYMHFSLLHQFHFSLFFFSQEDLFQDIRVRLPLYC